MNREKQVGMEELAVDSVSSLGYLCLHLRDTLQLPPVLLHCSSQELWGSGGGSGLPEGTGNDKSRLFYPQVTSWVQNRLMLPQNPKPYPFTTSTPYIFTAYIVQFGFPVFPLVRLLNIIPDGLFFLLISVILLLLLLTALLLLYDAFLLLLVLQKEQWGVNPQKKKSR